MCQLLMMLISMEIDNVPPHAKLFELYHDFQNILGHF